MRKLFVVGLLALTLAGCGRSPSYYGGGLAMQALVRPEPEQQFSYNHDLSLGMSRDTIKPRFERAQNACLRDTALGCTLIVASINMSEEMPVYGSGSYAEILVSLPHSEVAEFEKDVIAPINGEGAIVTSRSTSAENVSKDATDAIRKVAQLTDYRDRLAALAKRSNLSVDDLIKVQSELSKAQSDLDDATSQKKDVSERAVKERLSIHFGEKPGLADAFRPVGQVARDAVRLFGESTANALQFLIQIVPWLPIIVVAFFLSRWFWRLARRNSNVTNSGGARTNGE